MRIRKLRIRVCEDLVSARSVGVAAEPEFGRAGGGVEGAERDVGDYEEGALWGCERERGGRVMGEGTWGWKNVMSL